MLEALASGVLPSSSALFTSAFASKRARTTSKCPLQEAQYSGVLSSLLGLVHLRLASKRARTTSKCPFREAKYSGVHLYYGLVHLPSRPRGPALPPSAHSRRPSTVESYRIISLVHLRLRPRGPALPLPGGPAVESHYWSCSPAFASKSPYYKCPFMEAWLMSLPTSLALFTSAPLSMRHFATSKYPLSIASIRVVEYPKYRPLTLVSLASLLKA